MHALARIHCALALLLLLAVDSSISEWAIGPFCCSSYDYQMPRSMVARYYEQKIDNDCKLHAIVFLHKNGTPFCGNPSEEWVNNYMNELDLENKA